VFSLLTLSGVSIARAPELFFIFSCCAVMAEKTDLINLAKRKAAYQAVDENVKDGQVVGIGSGSSVVFAVERIVERVKNEGEYAHGARAGVKKVRFVCRAKRASYAGRYYLYYVILLFQFVCV